MGVEPPNSRLGTPVSAQQRPRKCDSELIFLIAYYGSRPKSEI